VADIGAGVRGVVCELLSRVECETATTDDAMW
jgi:hypothetical protein